MQVEEEYLCTFWLMTLTLSDAPPAPHHPFPAAPQQRVMYVPAWPAVQSGPLPLMPLTKPAPPAQFPVPPAPLFQAPPAAMPATPVAPPAVPPQHFSQPLGSWGPMPNYYPAPVQLYLIGYPLVPWPPY